MGGRQLLDPRWHWLISAMQKLHGELEPSDIVFSLTVLAESDGEVISYTLSPASREIDRRVVTAFSALAEAAEAATTNVSVE